jgi:hypothetical protein
MMILSGMKPDGTGVGRLVTCLVAEATDRPARDVRIVCRQSWKRPLDLVRHARFGEALTAWRDQRQWQSLLSDSAVRTANPLVLIHPQALGAVWCERLIESRSLPTWLYLMDSSFFCLRSYNHIDIEHAACTRCLGGRWQWAAQLGCQPWPVPDAATSRLLVRLRDWIASGKVCCLVQNQRQAELLKEHCGGTPVIRVVGLWTADLNDIPAQPPRAPHLPQQSGKVVFHGVSIASKGAHWAIEMARHASQLTFLFPFKARQLKVGADALPPNAHFVPMTWESGLAEEVATAAMVLVPSLWSATMEGALLKSIITARAVAVVDEPTAYSSELPAGLVLRLPGDPCQAAQQIKAALAENWAPSTKLKGGWVAQFERDNRNLLGRLMATTQSLSKAA